MKNRLIVLLVLLATLLLLVACGGGETAVSEPPEAPDVTEEAEEEMEEAVAIDGDAETVVPEALGVLPEETAEMRTIVDALDREVTIPADPQRIVAISEIDLDSLLALGVVPVGAPNGRGQSGLPSYMLPYIEGQTTSIGGLYEPNLETIITLDPDLIIFSDPWGELLDLIPQLEQIAPVVVPYVDTGAWHWKHVFTAVADVLDRAADAEAWFAAYDEQTAVIEANLSDDTNQVSIVRWMADGPRILLSNAFSSDVLADAGFSRPGYQLELAGSHPVHTDVISMEQIEVIDAPIVFAGGLNEDGSAVLQEALENPLMQTLSSVQSDHFFIVDGLAWSSTGGPTAALQVLSDVENAINQFSE